MTGFVFGKFLPFHKGHQALIEFAAKHCDKLIVLICCSNKESIPEAVRLQWLKETFAADYQIFPQLLEYDESELPNTSVSSMEVSEIWSGKFKEILPDVELLVSSEPYGEFVANFMEIDHIVFDPARIFVPVSGTMIRKNPRACWQYLPNTVKPFYQRKIVILGTESTGKSTLCELLSKHLMATWVLETGRELIPDSTNFSIEDLYIVASAHLKKVFQAIGEFPPMIIFDTDIHITQSYAKFSFGQYLELPAEWYETQKADLYIYLDNDVSFIQDGTRLAVENRNALDISHRETLRHFGIRYETVSGDWENRFQKSLELIYKLL